MRAALVVLLFGLGSVLWAQGLPQGCAPRTNVRTVRLVQSPTGDAWLGNYFIERMAGTLTPAQMSYTISYDACAFSEAAGNSAQVVLRLFNMAIGGHHTYRNVDVSQKMLPSRLEARFTFLKTNGSTLAVFDIDTCCLTNPLDAHEWRFNPAGVDSALLVQACSATMDRVQLTYTNADKERFEAYTTLVDAYYTADVQLNEIEKSLDVIRTDNIDMMPLYQIDIGNLKKQFDRIENQSFFTGLDLSQTDPLNFKARFKYLKDKFSAVSVVVNHLMSSIDEVYFNKGYSFLLKNNYEKAIEYFERSIRSNPLYVRSHYRLAEVYFMKGATDSSASIVQHIYSKLHIEKDIEANVMALARQIMQEYNNKGEQLVRNEDFHNALLSFAKADTFCKSIASLTCLPSIQYGMDNARRGIYKSYLTIASKAVENGKTELAAKFLYDARQYMNNNPGLNINPRETDDIIRRVVDMLVAEGRQHYNTALYDQAVSVFNKAMDLCRITGNASCIQLVESEISMAKTGLFENILVIIRNYIEQEQIEQAEQLLNEAKRFQSEHKVSNQAIYETENLGMMLDRLKYRRDSEAGRLHKANGDCATALDFFIRAKNLEKDKIAFPDVLLAEDIRVCGRPFVMKALSEARVKAWANDLNGAVILRDSINIKIRQYLLTGDSLVALQYAELETRIRSQQCANLAFDTEKKMHASSRYADSRDYIAACKILEEARTAMRLLPFCQADSITINKRLKDFESPRAYQTLVREAKAAAAAQNFPKTDSILASIAQVYNAHTSLRSMFPEYNHKALLNDVYERDFLSAFAAYQLDKGNALLALHALVKAKDKYYDAADFFLLQQHTARAIATADYRIKPRPFPEKRFSELGTQSNWFDVFRATYKKTFMLKKYSLGLF